MTPTALRAPPPKWGRCGEKRQGPLGREASGAARVLSITAPFLAIAPVRDA